MKLKEFIESLNYIVETEPRAMDFEVLYSEDEEGNGYHKVQIHPTVVKLENNEEDFDLKVSFYSPHSIIKPNAVIIN